jgi:hypothetical protein
VVDAGRSHGGKCLASFTGKIPGEPISQSNAFPIHACIVRRVVVEEVGRFDPSLRTCEDWDLWQRIARLGARFGRIPDVLAWYRLRPYASWTSSSKFFIDGLRLVTQGHSPDLRVPSPHPLHARGWEPERLASDKLYFTSFCAGMELARDGDAPAGAKRWLMIAILILILTA